MIGIRSRTSSVGSKSSEEEHPSNKKLRTDTDDIDMMEAQQENETPREKAQKILRMMKDYPEMHEELKGQMDELFDSIDRSILTLTVQKKGTSFAQMAARQPTAQKQKTAPNRKTSLFIKPDGQKECKEIFKEIQERIQPQKENITVSRISIINSNLIKIVADNKQDACRMKEILAEKVESIRVDEKKKFNPRIIVFGVDARLDDRQLLEQIHQNSSQLKESVEWDDFAKNIKVLKRTKETNLRQVNVIIELHPQIRSQLYIDGKQKLRIDWKTQLERLVLCAEMPKMSENRTSPLKVSKQTNMLKMRRRTQVKNLHQISNPTLLPMWFVVQTPGTIAAQPRRQKLFSSSA